MTESPFIYCPYCATKLQPQTVYSRRRPVCPACGYIHFPDPKVAVIGLVTALDHVLLIRRGVDPGKGKWALPGGYMDAGELPDSALRRELMEEVGIDVVVDRLMAIFPMAGTSVSNRGIVLAYRATPIEPGLPQLWERDDVVQAGWFNHNQLPAPLAFDSTIALLNSWQNRSE